MTISDCPEDKGFKMQGEFCLKKLEGKKTWLDGRAECEALGAHLPKIDDQKLQNIIVEQLEIIPKRTWIGN